VQLIDRLSATGLTTIEAGSFVSPNGCRKWRTPPTFSPASSACPVFPYPVLVPNLRAMRPPRARSRGFDRGFRRCLRDVLEEKHQRVDRRSLDRYEESAPRRGRARSPSRLISCALWCPYEGAISPQTVADVAARFRAMGCYEIARRHHRQRARPAKCSA
jgi:hydroxymethylglutaryl-CoA lyase